MAELRLKIERGEYLAIAEVKERDIARISIVKRGLLNLPKEISGRLVGLEQKEIEVTLRVVVRALLTRFEEL